MISINEHYKKLNSSYLFSDIAQRVSKYQKSHPEKKIIKLGIGDVTEPLPPACINAMHKACDEMGNRESFKGYGPEQGYEFLREIIAENDFKARGANISANDIFVSDGAKCDTGSFQELFTQSIKIAVPDPVYPVYVDTNVMAGRTGNYVDGRYQDLIYLESTKDNKFVPELPENQVDLIYLCYPNNPTGATITKVELEKWVRYAEKNNALILFDAAYEAFIQDEALPKSIYEIPGADKVAVEFRSFSKTAGFTGIRCAYTVVPESCIVYDEAGEPTKLRDYWNRRQTTRFNGVSYPVQCAANAVYSEEGQKQVKELISYYLKNAVVIREGLTSMGYNCTGGENSPYIWVETQTDSWEFFDLLLEKAGVVCTPGSGFGKCGEGFVRISAFNQYEKVVEAIDRITKLK